MDNETLFTVKGNGNFKGVAHMLLIGRLIIGKENWVERQRTRVLFPELPVQPCVDPTDTAVPLGLDMPATGSRGGGGASGEEIHNSHLTFYWRPPRAIGLLRWLRGKEPAC